ncbi:hypothetical protein LCGC14_2066730, partial [marine sediment metagenome]
LADEKIIFACVDSMEARRGIFENEAEHFSFFCDGRMAAEICRILTADSGDKGSMDCYVNSLHTDEEALDEACTAKSTCYCACIAAGLMVAQFSKYLRSIPLFTPQIILNILTAELVAEPPKPRKEVEKE